MNDKKIRKINKKELLEILLSQAKRIEELEQQLEKTQKKLDSKKIAIENSGSLAEASLKLNGIFEMAQATAEQYLLNIKEKCKKIENDTKKECQIKTEQMIKEEQEQQDLAEKKCQQKEALAEEKLKKIELKIKESNKTTKKNTINSITENNKKINISNESKNIKEKVSNKKTVDNEKEIICKVLVEKSKKAIKGRPIKTIKKGLLVYE